MKTMDQWWMGTRFMTLSSFLLKAKIESFQEAQNLSITHLDDVQRHPPKWDFYQLTRHRGFAQTSNIETWLLWTKWCCTLHQPPFSLITWLPNPSTNYSWLKYQSRTSDSTPGNWFSSRLAMATRKLLCSKHLSSAMSKSEGWKINL